VKSVIDVAHSPDADDIFMYYAIKFGWVGIPWATFENIALDIETLNRFCLDGKYSVSAISFGLYPKIRDEYALLRCGVSFGSGYGPKLVKKKGRKLSRNFKVALSGQNTTNALLFKLKYPNARISYCNFLDIEQKVIEGEVDAGVLIHESILTYDESLEVEAEMWDIWCDLAKKELPLPLGGMAIRRSIPLKKALDIEEVLIKAVQVANSSKNLLATMLLERNLVRVDSAKLDRYLKMYANEDSASLNPLQIEGINRLFELGYERGIFEALIKAEDYMLPLEYRELRNS